MEQRKICALTKQWIGELVNLGAMQDILPLLSPDNVSASEQGITLKNRNAQGMGLYLYPGYSAPEVYTGQAGEASKVYFVGAVMYALQTGSVAPDAQTRLQTGAPLLLGTDALANVINRATVPNAAMRVATLQQLWQEVDAAEKALTASSAPVAAVAPIVAAGTASAPEAVATAAQEAQTTVAAAAETVKDSAKEAKETVVEAVAEAPKKITRGKKKQENPAAEGPKAEPVTDEAKTEPAAEEKKDEPAAAVPAPAPASEMAPVSTQSSTPSASAALAPPNGYAPQPAAPIAAAPNQQARQTAAPMGYAQGQFGQPAVYGAPPAMAQPPQKQKKKPKKGVLIVVIVGLLVAGVVYTLVQGNRINQAYTSGDYATVVSTADMTPWLKGIKREMYDYARAQLFLQEGDLEESLEIFEDLGDYENSSHMAQSVKYDLASQLLEQGKINEALALFKEIRGYQDTNSIISDIELYLSAGEAESALDKYDIYMSLGNFLDSAERAAALGGEVYEEALEQYKNGNYSSAGTYFASLRDYEDAVLYAEACSIYESASSTQYNTSYIPRLKELSQSIDVNGILTSDKFLMEWLNGYWTTGSGGVFSLSISSKTFRFYDVTGSHNFYNSGMYNSSTGALVCQFTYVSFNEMIVTMASGTEYLFTRS